MYSGQENNDVNRYSWEPDFVKLDYVILYLYENNLQLLLLLELHKRFI